MKKFKNPAKIEQVFGKPDETEETKSAEQPAEEYDVLSEYATEEPEQASQNEELSEKQLQKQSEIEGVKSKISQILKSSNIEIVDENFGDEYESDESDASKQSQQDYDTLKALFGDKDRNKKDELTLTIDDFDYTYVGNYVEDFDLMHLKNIKRIKLHNPNIKKIKKALIVASLVLIVAIGGTVGYLMTRKTPVVISSVSLSQAASTSTYYVGETFSYDGLYIVVKYSDGSTKKVKLSGKHFDASKTEGYINSQQNTISFLGGNVAMAFKYEGYNLTYNVEVKNKKIEAISANFSDKILNLNAGDYIYGYGNGKTDLIVLMDYGDYGLSKAVDYTKINLLVDGEYMPYDYSVGGWRLTKSTKNANVSIEYRQGEDLFSHQIKN